MENKLTLSRRTQSCESSSLPQPRKPQMSRTHASQLPSDLTVTRCVQYITRQPTPFQDKCYSRNNQNRKIYCSGGKVAFEMLCPFAECDYARKSTAQAFG